MNLYQKYGEWRIPEDTTRCIVDVWKPGSWHGHQCSRKRGYGRKGLFCKQHAKQYKDRKCDKE